MKAILDRFRPDERQRDATIPCVVEETLHRVLRQREVERMVCGGYRRSEPSGTTTLRFLPQEIDEPGFTIVGIAEVSPTFAASHTPTLSSLQLQLLNARAILGAFP